MDQKKCEQIKSDRGQVYGPPLQNHEELAQIFAPLLRPWWNKIRDGTPLPAHVVALILMGLKLCRMRLRYHDDNFDDMINYNEFAREWQRDWQIKKDSERPCPERIYVSGPYSGPTLDDIAENCDLASEVGLSLLNKGHYVLVPHNATGPWGININYERAMDIDFNYIKYWATAIFYMAPSPGANRELELAKQLGLKIYYNIDDVPEVGNL